jgi:hypothetical protein
MSWINSIKSIFGEKAEDPLLNEEGMKEFLINEMKREFTDFQFLSYQNKCFTFQRIRSFKGFNVYEAFHLFWSFEDQNFCCSVASRLNPEYIHSNQYNSGLINPHVDLIVLKKKVNAVRMEQTVYFFRNTRLKTVREVIQQIIKDYKFFGINFLDRQQRKRDYSLYLSHGLAFLSELTIDKSALKREIEDYLHNGRNWISSVKSPAYENLKERLRQIPGQSREERKNIPRLAFDLIELYCVQR